ncbi:JAB domain-containing protein [Pantoea sp. Morm]|jgi:DNA repair protein RadC|uniref:JAB domain-containing protein n=1 Tax=Pantoea sp. Morm TaxID=2601250 RepID=UPI00387EB2CE
MQNTLVNVTPDVITDCALTEIMTSHDDQNIIDTAYESIADWVETLSDNVSFFTRLQIRDAQGNYVMATESQILEEAARAIEHRYPTGTFFASAAVSEEFFRAKLAGRDREIFAVAFLNNQHQLLAYEEMFQGSVSSVEVHPRVLVCRALQLNAAAIIVSHNHPSFLKEPSRADIAITGRLKKALELVAVRLIDHIIVAGNETVSLAQLGHIDS